MLVIEKLKFIYRPFLLVISFLSFSYSINAQLNQKDWKIWSNPDNVDSIRFKAIDDIIWEGFIYENPDSAIYYSKLQLDFSVRIKNQKYQAITLNTLASCYYIKDNFNKAIYYYQQSLKKYTAIHDTKGQSTIYNNLGNISKERGDFVSAIDYYTSSLKIDEKLKNESGIASCLNNIGILYANQDQFDIAIRYYKRSIVIRKRIKDHEGMASPLNNMGNVYEYKKEFFKAIEYYQESLEIEKNSNNTVGIATSLFNIAGAYKQLADITKNKNRSTEYYTKSKELSYKVLEMSNDLGQNTIIAFTLTNLASIYQAEGLTNEAIEAGNRALNIAKVTGAVRSIRDAAELLYHSYKKNNDEQNSLKMFELFVQMKDSIHSSENQDEIIRQEYKYKYDKQVEADSLIQAKEKEITLVQLKQEKTKKIALISGLILMLIFLVFMYNRYKVTLKQKEIISKKEQETNRQKGLLETKNKEITDSINYAKRIQAAILPAPKIVKEYLKDSFVLYIPRDIVAGDFYWMEQIENGLIFAAADCTGHGVPGAMVSVLCNNALNRSVREYKLQDPGEILNKTREIIIHEFDKSEDNVNDGMDVSLCTLLFNDTDTEHLHPYQLKWAGANNPLWIIRNNELIEFKPDKQPIGKYYENKPFTSHTIDIQKGDCIYTFTDGYKDQFGGLNNGDSGKKLKANRMKELLIHLSNLPMEQQKQKLEDFFYEWKGDLEQVDDVCIIGVRID